MSKIIIIYIFNYAERINKGKYIFIECLLYSKLLIYPFRFSLFPWTLVTICCHFLMPVYLFPYPPPSRCYCQMYYRVIMQLYTHYFLQFTFEIMRSKKQCIIILSFVTTYAFTFTGTLFSYVDLNYFSCHALAE